MLGEIEKSSDVCRTASLSEMDHEQRAAMSSTVTDHRRKNFFVHKSSFVIEVPPNRRNTLGCVAGLTLVLVCVTAAGLLVVIQ